MKHPLVTLITHPTQPSGSRAARGYDLDYDRLFEIAVETGTVVEIDGAPSHLDLSDALARRAIAAGATVAIDSDCHRAEMLRPSDGPRHRHRAARLGGAAPRAERATARGRPVPRSPPSAPRADRADAA